MTRLTFCPCDKWRRFYDSMLLQGDPKVDSMTQCPFCNGKMQER